MKTELLRALILTPVVAVIDWQVLVSLPLAVVVVVGIPVVGIAMLVAAWIKQRPRILTLGVALVLSGLSGGALAIYLNRQQVAANVALGDQVAAALDEHWGAHGSYPDSLIQLAPAYLEDVPTPSSGLFVGAPFWYTPSKQEDGFVIGYQAARGIALMRVKGKWSPVPVPWWTFYPW